MKFEYPDRDRDTENFVTKTVTFQKIKFRLFLKTFIRVNVLNSILRHYSWHTLHF